MTNTTPFSIENTVFEQHRQEWLHAHLGMYVVIQDQKVMDGFYGTYAEALKAGLNTFGVTRGFLVKQVWTSEPVYVVS